MKNVAKMIYASGERSADMLYATGLSTPDEFFYFEFGIRRIILISELEYDRAKKMAHSGIEVMSYKEVAPARDCESYVDAIAKKFDLTGFVVPQDFPYGLADSLIKVGYALRPIEDSFFRQREFKNAREVEEITKSLRAAEAGLERAFVILRESRIGGDGKIMWGDQPLTSEILRGEIDATMLKLEMLPTGTICAGNLAGACPHDVGSGVLYAGYPIVMDIFPRSAVSGYWGDLTRTVVKGVASPTLRAMYEAVLATRKAAEAEITIGADPHEIHRRAAERLKNAGFETGFDPKRGNYGFFHGLGHGVGLEIHEMPRLSRRESPTLKGGEVVTVEPGLYYPELGGIRLEDMVYLNPNGKAQVLTNAPDFFEIE